MKNKTGIIQGVILIALLYLFFIILRPFLASIIMALVFAVVFYPLSEKLRKSFKLHSGLAAFITLIITVLIVIIPVIVLLGLIGKESVNLLQNFRIEDAYQFLGDYKNFTILNIEIDLVEQQEKILNTLKSLSGYISSTAVDILGSILNSIYKFFVFLLMYFYFLKDRVLLLERLQKALPYDSKQSKTLTHQFYKISKTVFHATILSASISGLFAAIGFYLLGLGSPLIWGLLVALLSLIPTIGSLFVYLIGAFVAFLVGGWQTVLGLLVFYIVFDLIFTENFIKPKLLDDKLAVHPILIFFAIVGGMNAFGAMGILYGPIVVIFLGTTYELSASK